jgi:hypothetical protein
VLNGFVTRLGHAVGRMFQTTFPQLPEFQGRQVVTLHNQRDFLFFRRHRFVRVLPCTIMLERIPFQICVPFDRESCFTRNWPPFHPKTSLAEERHPCCISIWRGTRATGDRFSLRSCGRIRRSNPPDFRRKAQENSTTQTR